MATMEDALGLPVVRPVLIGRLDIAGDPILAWDGPGIFAPSGTGDPALDGQLFDPVEAFVSMTDVQSDQGLGGPLTITASGADLDDPALRQLVRDRRVYQGRNAWVWLGLLDEDEASVIPDPVRLKTGVITTMTVRRDRDQATVEIVIDEDLGGARGRGVKIIEHDAFWPGDTFSSFALRLLNSRQGIPGLSDSERSPPGPRGPFGGFPQGPDDPIGNIPRGPFGGFG